MTNPTVPSPLCNLVSELVTGAPSFNSVQHSFCGLQLIVNASKTKCVLFNRSLPAPARLTSITTLDGSDVEYVDNYKYLGVWLDCKHSFQTRIKHLQSKVKSRIGLFRNKASFTHAAQHSLLQLTILPILDFDVIYKIASNIPSSINWMQSITVQSGLSPKPHILPTIATHAHLWPAGGHFAGLRQCSSCSSLHKGGGCGPAAGLLPSYGLLHVS